MQLEGAKVLLTGTFGGDGREALEEKLAGKGARVVKKISMEIEAVFSGKDPGKEYDQARELGIRVYSEQDLTALLDGKQPEQKQPVVDDALLDSYMAGGSRNDGPADYVIYEEAYAMVPDDKEGYLAAPAKSSSKKQTRNEKPSKAKEKATMNTAATKQFDKGDRVKIVSGLEGVGVVGEIFWWGDSKFGDGMRAGVSGPGETTYWVDEEHLGWPDEEIDEEVLEAAKEASQFKRGDYVKVIAGKDAGSEGEIFWWGESKFGDGMRAGIETSNGAKVWAAANELEHADGGGADGGGDDDFAPIADDDIPF